MILRTFEEDGKTLTLRQRPSVTAPSGCDYDLILDNVVLLSSAALETERVFGELAGAAAKHVIVGGLGFGATLRGVLSVVGADARVTVVEKLATPAALLRSELAHLALADGGTASILDDPRVTIVRADIGDALSTARGVDAILLDVDNGPDWASFRSNARLYAAPGLAVARVALAPNGRLAVWSGYKADAFLARLRAAGFTASLVPLRERGIVRARAYLGTLT